MEKLSSILRKISLEIKDGKVKIFHIGREPARAHKHYTSHSERPYAAASYPEGWRRPGHPLAAEEGFISKPVAFFTTEKYLRNVAYQISGFHDPRSLDKKVHVYLAPVEMVKKYRQKFDNAEEIILDQENINKLEYLGVYKKHPTARELRELEKDTSHLEVLPNYEKEVSKKDREIADEKLKKERIDRRKRENWKSIMKRKERSRPKEKRI